MGSLMSLGQRELSVIVKRGVCIMGVEIARSLVSLRPKEPSIIEGFFYY